MIKRRLWILMAVLALLAGCSKTPVPPEPDPDPVEEPEDPIPPSPPYEVEESDFYTWRDGLRIGGVLFTPKGLKSDIPAIIFCHGLDGSWVDTEPYGRAVARMGFVACCFDFCGGPQGTSKSEGERSANSILTEIRDLAAVYGAIAARKEIDPSKIYLMGGSQGGLVTALYAADNPSGVAALGLMFPAFNLPEMVRLYTGLYGGLDKLPESVNLYGHTIWRQYAIDAYDLQPYEVIGNYEGPVLILHGDKDTTVPLSYSETALTKYKNASLHVLEGEGHGFSPAGTEIAIEYLEAFLEDQ